jgi:UDP-N-acetylmuramoylalanine--D-glutamate ligase
MDRYDSMAEYAQAKARIFRHARVRVVNRDDAVSRGMAAGDTFSFGLGVPASRAEWGLDAARRHLRRGDEDFLHVDAMKLQGLHNAANALAAHALMTAVDAPPAALSQAIREFAGLPHRATLVAEARGVRFIDDSKGTNVGSTLAALEGATRPVVLIAGGDGKGQDFSPLAAAVAKRARGVVLIGRDAPVLRAALAPSGVPLKDAATMDDAVAAAFALARPGDDVLLSPACASLDMFRNYGHRGDVFAAAARDVAKGAG